MDWPSRFGASVKSAYEELAQRFVDRREVLLGRNYPAEPEEHCVPTNFLWARTVVCPYCDGLVPLSPNWKLEPSGIGVRLLADPAEGPGTPGRVCAFEIVNSTREHSEGTVARGTATCPFGDCGRVIEGDEIKGQAQAGRMGEQLFTVVYKRRVETTTKSGKAGRDRWERGYRAPRPEDDNSEEIRARLAEKLPEWEAFGIVPTEEFPADSNDDRPIQYGMPLWRDLFSPRQLLCHGTSVEVFHEMLEADRAAGKLDDLRRAAYGYLAVALDKLLNYNSRLVRWITQRSVVASTFDRHDFAFVWSYAEMAPLVAGVGYDWAVRQTAKCIGELVGLLGADEAPNPLFGSAPEPPITITCKSGDALDHLADGSVDLVVMDPPYYDNVMYAELSDFFYVWLKRTAGKVFPELFRRRLTDKENEAVANPARFAGQKRARALAGRDYQHRMAAIFAECRRVLKPDGLMTLMFTHKATGAWDALTTGLMEAGFEIRASWPIQTEASGSLHIRDKAAARSTVFLVCRPRQADAVVDDGSSLAADRGTGYAAVEGEGLPTYWEDVEPRVAKAVRDRVGSLQDAGIEGVDLYIACFGPALEEFSRHWPLRRGTPRERDRSAVRGLFDERWDPYAVTPEDALLVARRELKNWRFENLAGLKPWQDLDPPTAFFVLAWDTFRAPVFAYDEALMLARAAGVDLDQEVVGRFAMRKGSDLQLWDSERRAKEGKLGALGDARALDTLHRAAHLARTSTLAAGRDLLEQLGLHENPQFAAALQAVLEVLPLPGKITGFDLSGEIGAASSDWEVLNGLRLLAFTRMVPEPKQLRLFKPPDS